MAVLSLGKNCKNDTSSTVASFSLMTDVCLPTDTGLFFSIVDTSTGEIIVRNTKKVSKLNFDIFKPLLKAFFDSVRSCPDKEITFKILPSTQLDSDFEGSGRDLRFLYDSIKAHSELDKLGKDVY